MINYDELDPGIRDVVRAINEWGWKPCDSGDGSKAGTMECALDHPHVFCEAKGVGFALNLEAHALTALLLQRFGPGWYVEANYSTKDGLAILCAQKDVEGEAASAASMPLPEAQHHDAPTPDIDPKEVRRLSDYVLDPAGVHRFDSYIVRLATFAREYLRLREQPAPDVQAQDANLIARLRNRVRVSPYELLAEVEKGDIETACARLADVQAQIDAAVAREREAREALDRGLIAVEALINESDGVAGLHRNGDLAPWSELRAGGRFEEWLREFDAALDTIRARSGAKGAG